MLHTKFQGHRSIGSGEEDFFKVFTIYGHGGYVGHVTQLICINFHSFLPQAFSYSGRTHSAAYRGYGYVWLRFGGNVVRRMGTQQQPSSFHMNFGSKSPNCF